MKSKRGNLKIIKRSETPKFLKRSITISTKTYKNGRLIMEPIIPCWKKTQKELKKQ